MEYARAIVDELAQPFCRRPQNGHQYARAIVDELGEVVAWCKDLTQEQIRLCKIGIYCDVDVKEARLKIKLLKNALYK